MNGNAPISFATKELSDLALPHQAGVDPFTGAATVTVTLPLTSGRADFQPSLSLAYNSSAGNSPFGLGWSLSGVPTVGRSFKDGLPRYDDSDTFTFSGAELVPWLEETVDGWQPRVYDGGDHWIHLYRNQVEEGFLRFEKWVDKGTQRIHWRMRDRENGVFIFGRETRGSTQIYDSQDEERVFQWLLEAQYDRHGNAIFYQYVSENDENVDAATSFERYRIIHSRTFAQRYLKRILYGNTHPLRPDEPEPADNAWLFEVVLDYGEHAEDPAETHPTGSMWSARPDPFSSYRGGFEIRTYRLCRRILLFHHFSELGTDPTLIGNFELDHRPDATGTTLEEIGYTGYRREAGTYTSKTLPPLRFHYAQPRVGRSFHAAPEQTGENVPFGIGGLNYRWVDLHGEGLPGVLYESNQAWYYKPNLGNGRLGAQQKVLSRPASNPGTYAVSDFDGDGNLNLVVLQGREAGYYEYQRDEEQWSGYRSFTAAPHVKALDATTQLLDLNGDGRADIVSVEQERIAWYPSLGKEGFGPPVELAKSRTNGRSMAPTLGANPALDYFFADMSGDGLPDQVRVSNGRVEYWPQLGHGRFGPGVVMEDAPILDFDADFDAGRIRLVDLDGSGTADLLYIGRGEIRYWINASGNRFLEGGTLHGLPHIDNLSSAQVLDFLGDGTPCLVWSSALPGRAQAPIHYLPLTGGTRPRLLLSMENGMGLETTVTYSYSAAHYLRDREAGRPWQSKLPRHTVVVDRVTFIDQIGNTRFESVYAYHDGFFDSEERQFRGFGLVDQYDTDTYHSADGDPEAVYSDPVCVRTWFHNGAPGWHRRRRHFYQGGGDALTVPAATVEAELGPLQDSEYRAAFRALAGRPLRVETYGVSVGERREHPYQVEQTGYQVAHLQPEKDGRDACFAPRVRETLTYLYEENPADPRISQVLILEVDTYGNVRESATVAYPRRSDRQIGIPAQAEVAIQAARLDVTSMDTVDHYETAIPHQSWAYEVAGIELPAGGLFIPDTLGPQLRVLMDHPLDFGLDFTEDPGARVVEWTRLFYWDDARSGPLPHRQAGRHSLLHHTESAAFTPTLFGDIFVGKLPADAPASEGRYRLADRYWWQPSATLEYGPSDGFNLLRAEARLDGGRTEYEYDGAYSLNPVAVREFLAPGTFNEVRARIDYHLPAPEQITDPNGNVAEVRYDPLGMVVAAASQGQVLSEDGTTAPYGDEGLASYRLREPDPAAPVADILAWPAAFLQGAGAFFYYDLQSWADRRAPIPSLSLAREQLVHDGEGGGAAGGRIQTAVSYADGFGRTLQSKQRVEPGQAIQRDGAGNIVLRDGAPLLVDSDPRWRGSGFAVYNNKQEVVRQFEPFFSPSHAFEPDAVLQTLGESSTAHYDPLGRLVETDYPNGTRSHEEFAAWASRQFDPNDNDSSSVHYDTPTTVHYDPLGREVVVVEDGGAEGVRRTELTLDYAGKPLRIRDPLGFVDPARPDAFTYRRDMLGRVLYEESMDAGEKWAFVDALERPLHSWDSRDTHRRLTYDRLGRVTAVDVETPARRYVAERFVYGEDLDRAEAQRRNALGQLVRHHDQAGVVRFHRYDTGGNPLAYERQLATDYEREPHWPHTRPGAVSLEPERYQTRLRYDALGRTTRQQLADGTTRELRYERGGNVEQILVSTDDGTLVDRPILQETTYNVRGQRTGALLGNGVAVRYEYDPLSYRLSRLYAHQPDPAAPEHPPLRVYQDIGYSYDAVGNITRLVDEAQTARSDVLRGLAVAAESTFTYDAFYQLQSATGRVHEALQQDDYRWREADSDPGWLKGSRYLSLNDGGQVRRYTRRYRYDLNGNRERIEHHQPDRSWHADYWISRTSNRSLPLEDLQGIPIPNPETHFDGNGNCLYLPHLRRFAWNDRDHLAQAVLIERGGGEPDDVEYYVYGGDGQRVRKVTQKLLGDGRRRISEKIYLDGCEIKRVLDDGAPILRRITSHIGDESGRLALLHRWQLDTSGRETTSAPATRIHYQLGNHLGSASLELDESGGVISYEEYFPFGGTAFVAGRSVRDVRRKDYRYSGKERDDATGLYYYGFRYYVPWLGRWLSPDPIGPEDGLNLYRFVQNNPVALVDQRGLSSGHELDVVFHFLDSTDLPEHVDRDSIQYFGISHEGTMISLPPNAVLAWAEAHSGTNEPPPQIAIYDPSGELREMENVQRALELGRRENTFVLTFVLTDLGATDDSPPGPLGAGSDEGLSAHGGEEDDDHGEVDEGDGPREGNTSVGNSGDGNGSGPPGPGSGTTGTGATRSSRRRRDGSGGAGRALSSPGGSTRTSGSQNGAGRALGSPGGGGEGGVSERRGTPGETPSDGSTDPRAIPGGNPNGTLTGPEHLNSDLAVGPGNPNGSETGSLTGQSYGREAEELALWQTALIITATIAVAILVTVVTAGVGAIMLGSALATGGLVGGLAVTAIGAVAGALAGAASDVVYQSLTSLAETGGREISVDWEQTAQAAVLGAATGAFTAGAGAWLGSATRGLAQGAENAFLAGTASFAQRGLLSMNGWYQTSALFRGAVRGTRGALLGGSESSLAEAGRQLWSQGEISDPAGVGLQGLIGAGTGGALDATVGAVGDLRQGSSNRFRGQRVVDEAGQEIGEIFGSMPRFLQGEIKPNNVRGIRGGEYQLGEPNRTGYAGLGEIESTGGGRVGLLSYDPDTGLIAGRVYDSNLQLLYHRIMGRLSPSALGRNMGTARLMSSATGRSPSSEFGFFVEHDIRLLAEAATGQSFTSVGRAGANGPDLTDSGLLLHLRRLFSN